MFRRLYPITLGLLGATVLTSCTSANLPVQSKAVVQPPRAQVGAVVDVTQGAFSPSVARIRAGEAVQWHWIPPLLPAQILAKTFHSPVQNKGSYFEVFKRPGVYRYRSGLSAIGHGTIVVAPRTQS